VHVQLGGVAKLVAPIIGKEPPDYHLLMGAARIPSFSVKRARSLREVPSGAYSK
jgi:hypothetical protein